MKSEEILFGDYVKKKREEMGISLRGLAEKIQISPAYLCDIEKGNRQPPAKFLKTLAEVLGIREDDELNAFYDLAGIGKNGQHSDINGYIEGLPSARMALRMAKNQNFTDEDWMELVEIIKQKKM